MTEPSTTHDTVATTESENATVSPDTQSAQSSEVTDTADTATAGGTEVTPEQAAEAEAAKLKQDAEAKAEAERIAVLVAEFQALIGTKDDDGHWTGGIMASDTDRDQATGTVPDGVLATIKAKFNELPAGVARKTVRQWLDGEVADAMDNVEDPFQARTLFQLKQQALVSVTGGGKPSAEKQPVNPTEAHVAFVTGLYLAPYTVVVPEGVEAGWDEKVGLRVNELMEYIEPYAKWLAAGQTIDADTTLTDEARTAKLAEYATAEPNTPAEVKDAFRIARGRSVLTPRKTRTASTGTASPRPARVAGDGVKRNVGTHITSAFADKPVGTWLTIAEIVKTRSDEYGDKPVSAGAVSARLFPDGDGEKCSVPGIKGRQNAEGKRGAVRVA